VADTVSLESVKALRYGLILAQFVSDPCKQARDPVTMGAMADLVDELMACAPEGTLAEKARLLVQRRVMR
jgi:hypothetical protein